jgi:hypothetical protein
MALVMTDIGHTAIAKALKERKFWLGLGGAPEGESWGINDDPPPFNPSKTQLDNTIGYRAATQVLFAQEDENGIIVAAGKRWSTTDQPTRHLYIAIHLDSEDAVGQTIYQIGLFIDLQPADGVAPGELFLTPEKVKDPGILLVAENIRPFYRQQGVREVFEFVLTL